MTICLSDQLATVSGVVQIIDRSTHPRTPVASRSRSGSLGVGRSTTVAKSGSETADGINRLRVVLDYVVCTEFVLETCGQLLAALDECNRFVPAAED